MADDLETGLETDVLDEHFTSGEDYADLSDEIKQTVAKHKSPADTVKAYAELSKKLGSDYRLPKDLSKLNEDQKADLITKVRSLRNVPEKAEDYKIETPEGVERDEDFIGAFLAIAHKQGKTNEEVQELADFYVNAIKAGKEKLLDRQEKDAHAAETQYRIKHGVNYDNVLKGIDIARYKYAEANGLLYRVEGEDKPRSKLDDALDMVDATGRKLGNQPVILDLLYHTYVRDWKASVPIPGSEEPGAAKGGTFSDDFYEKPT